MTWAFNHPINRLLASLLVLAIAALTTWAFTQHVPPVILAAVLAVPALIYLLIWFHRYFVAAFVFLIPLSIPYSFSDHVLAFPSEALLILLSLMAGMRLLFMGLPPRKLWMHPLSLLLLLDLGWTLVCVFFSEMPEVSMKRMLMKSMFILVFYFSFGSFFGKAENIRLFFGAYALGLVYPIIHTLMNHSVHNFVMRAAFMVTEPFYPEHTIYGACLAFVLIPLLYFSFSKQTTAAHRWGWLGLLSLAAIAVYFAYSRAAWISLLLVFLGWLTLRFRIRKHWLVLAALIGVAVLWVNFEVVLDNFERNTAVSSTEDVLEHVQSLTSISSDASNAERLNRWVSAWEMFKERPFFGFGPGTFQFQYGSYQQPEYLTRISTFRGDRGNAHSEYLNTLVESGLLGLLLLLAVIFSVFKAGIEVYWQSPQSTAGQLTLVAILALGTYFAHSLVNGFLDVDKAAILVYGALAIVVQQHLKYREAKADLPLD